MMLKGVSGMIYLSVGTMMGIFAVTESDPLFMWLAWVACATNVGCGVRLLSHAYREAYEDCE
jgi:hypothetical protein